MKRPFMIALAVVLAAAALGAHTDCHAGEPRWFREALKESLPSVPADADAALLLDRTELHVAADLTAGIHHVQAIQILRSSGLDHATFAVVLPPGGKLKQFDVWCWDGKERRSHAGRKDALETTYLPDEYTDTRRIILSVPDARAGDVVAAEYHVERRLWFPSWQWFPQPGGLATARAEVTIELPGGWRVEAKAARVTPRERLLGENVHRFTVGPLAAVPDEPERPPWLDVAPSVRLRFLDPDGARTFPVWKSVATWYQRLSAPNCDPGQAPEELLRRVPWDDPNRGVFLLAGEVQRSIHYAAIELGIQSWIPDFAADTWRRRYGDCKDKAALMVAALQARGIRARPVLVCTRDVAAVDPDAPDPGQFNHCIVAFDWPGEDPPDAVTTAGPSGASWTFFDPTDPYTPLGMLPRGDAGTWGVIADSTEGIVRLPSVAEASLHTRAHARVGRDGELSGSVDVTGAGVAVATLVYDFDEATDDQRKLRASAWLRSASSRPEILAVRWSGLDTTSLSASLGVEMRLTGGARRSGDVLVVRPLYVQVPADRFAPLPDTVRTLPFVLGGPATFEDHFEMEIPPGYRVDRLPDVTWSNSIGDYRLSGQVEGKTLVMTRRLILHHDVVPASAYDMVRQLVQQARAGDEALIVLRR